MPWTPSDLTTSGVKALFHQVIEATPQLWPNHCMQLSAETDPTPFAFPGFIPTPRQFISGRQLQSILSFTYNISTNEHELSFAIPRKYFEDDQTGLINARIAEIAEVWAIYKDSLFADLLTNGNVSGNNGWDGTTFHSDTRTIGGSANIDNNLTSAAATGTIPTVSEFLSAVGTARAQMLRFQDDTGRTSFNIAAIKDLRVIVPPTYMQAATEAVMAPIVSQTSNVWGVGLAKVDELGFLSADNEMWVNAVGSYRRPFVYLERTPLEIIVNQDVGDVAKSNAIEVFCRQRFVFAYGEPRRSVLHTFT